MSEELLWNLLVPVLTFVGTVAVVWGGMRAKLESIPAVQKGITDGIAERISTLEDTIHRRFNQTCATCRENTARVEHSVTQAHTRIDDCIKDHRA
jgi:hypothetical protein